MFTQKPHKQPWGCWEQRGCPLLSGGQTKDICAFCHRSQKVNLCRNGVCLLGCLGLGAEKGGERPLYRPLLSDD